MPRANQGDVSRNYQKAFNNSSENIYVLRLYVTGASAASTRAIANLRKLCEEHQKGHYQLEVIDIFQQPSLARGEQIVAAPTLVKVLPLPLRKFIGDMSKVEGLLLGLDVQPAPAHLA